jgi:hypothetical protein
MEERIPNYMVDKAGVSRHIVKMRGSAAMMELKSTTLEGDWIKMRFEDAEPEPLVQPHPDFWFEFEVLLDRLTMADGQTPLGNPAEKRLVTIQLAALHQLRDAVDEQIQGLSNLLTASR